VALIDHLFSIGWMRKAVWRLWYPFVTRRLRDEAVVFLNYGFEEDPPLAIPLRPEDEPDRACIQLYHHVAGQVPLRGRSVLEVSCGHGGGAAYLARTFRPQRYTGLDLNPEGVRFCQQRHQVDGLVFAQGDAGNLPYEANTFDAVVNVEASHCYPNLPRFLAEVARVLRPGGHFLYADFRFQERLEAWDQALSRAPFHLQRSRVINAEVLRGIQRNSVRSLDLIRRRLPRWLHSIGRDFAGLEGSPIYRALTNGQISYRSYCFEKTRP
jgi:SAM-dependent methyltransferase